MSMIFFPSKDSGAKWLCQDVLCRSDTSNELVITNPDQLSIDNKSSLNNISIGNNDSNSTDLKSYHLGSTAGGSNIPPAQEKQPVNKFTPNSELKVIPNHNRGDFDVSILNSDGIYLLELIDLLGRKIYNGVEKENNVSFDISKHTKGLYFVKATIGNEVFVEKIVCQNNFSGLILSVYTLLA